MNTDTNSHRKSNYVEIYSRMTEFRKKKVYVKGVGIVSLPSDESEDEEVDAKVLTCNLNNNQSSSSSSSYYSSEYDSSSDEDIYNDRISNKKLTSKDLSKLLKKEVNKIKKGNGGNTMVMNTND
jgi:hypothetical protein